MPTSWAPWPGNSQAVSLDVGSGRKRGPLLANARALDLDSLARLAAGAGGAGVVRAAHGAALGAAREARELQGQVAASLALPRLRITFLRQWYHGLFLPFRSGAVFGAEGRQVGEGEGGGPKPAAIGAHQLDAAADALGSATLGLERALHVVVAGSADAFLDEAGHVEKHGLVKHRRC